jgi:hypothetical protein
MGVALVFSVCAWTRVAITRNVGHPSIQHVRRIVRDAVAM